MMRSDDVFSCKHIGAFYTYQSYLQEEKTERPGAFSWGRVRVARLFGVCHYCRVAKMAPAVSSYSNGVGVDDN